MSARIVFIGAGSLGFTRDLARDILTFPLLENSELVLVDINKERLDFARRAVQSIIERGKYPARVIATMNRKEALMGADAVVCTILASPVQVWRHDIEIPKKYGVDVAVGDTRGPSGIFRALRTIPVMLDICRDMERLCPNAILLNYTNPMAMLCRAIQRKSFIRLIGLCHSVQGTAFMLAHWISPSAEKKMFDIVRQKKGKILMDFIETLNKQITYVCAGINHQAWFIEFKKHSKDAYPLLREELKKKEVYMKEPVRNEMFLHLGYYVTESSGHNSEYSWWFRKYPELIEKYGGGEYAWILREYLRIEKTWKADIKKWFDQGMPMSLERGHEYASYIMNAVMGGEPFKFNGNVPNTGLITNLPQGICVEVPVLADKRGFNSIHVGALPPQCAALNNINVAVEEMAVEAALTGDAVLLCRALYFDPLTAAVCSLEEIRKMVGEMLRRNKDYLPQFKSVKI